MTYELAPQAALDCLDLLDHYIIGVAVIVGRRPQGPAPTRIERLWTVPNRFTGYVADGRDDSDGYRIDVADMQEAELAAAAKGWQVLGHAHSHLHAKSLPSAGARGDIARIPRGHVGGIVHGASGTLTLFTGMHDRGQKWRVLQRFALDYSAAPILAYMAPVIWDAAKDTEKAEAAAPAEAAPPIRDTELVLYIARDLTSPEYAEEVAAERQASMGLTDWPPGFLEGLAKLMARAAA